MHFGKEKGGILRFNHPEEIVEPLQLEGKTILAIPGAVPETLLLQDPAAALASRIGWSFHFLGNIII
jgi:hypothetical protein